MYPIQITEGFTGHRHATAGSASPANDQPVVEPYDVTSNIIAFESGELDFDDVCELFQHLVDSGLAWSLQGTYGRTASALIGAGHVLARS